jgi:hypothetical protein
MSDELEAGGQLNALVAEKVMGWTGINHDALNRGGWPPPYRPPSMVGWQLVPEYSTDISAAWEVVEKVSSRNQDTIVVITRNSLDGKRMGGEDAYFCTIEDVSDGIEEWETSADSAPLAICRAALKAAAALPKGK